MRQTEAIIEDIKKLVSSKGYIYSLCMILFEDFYLTLEKLHEINYLERLSINEASLLLGFLIQNDIDFLSPENPLEIIELKKKTYALMKELHESFMMPFFEKLKKEITKEHNIENFQSEKKSFFDEGSLLIEPIFYSGTGIYDFQYTEFLERKYKYDEKWLLEKHKFNIVEIPKLVFKIKEVLQQKSNKVQLYSLKERLPQIVDELKKKYPVEDWGKRTKENLPFIELYQYKNLFFNSSVETENFEIKDIREEHWKTFYKNLIELFIVNKESIDNIANVDEFFEKFSLIPSINFNSQFHSIGDYNLINSRPLINLGNNKYFMPTTFLLFQAIYESPFYWMMNDKEYAEQAGTNRGLVGEEIGYEFLSKVFGNDRTFKGIKISTLKGKDDTDIDVLAVLGSKALCIQVKSKKLTQLSKKGNDKSLDADFKGAVQDAYEQGVKCRIKILEKKSKFINKDRNEIKLSEEIDEVFIMAVTTENYPSLTHQSHILLHKEKEEPFPIVLTVFDLELLAYYLSDPYDFLYYIVNP